MLAIKLQRIGKKGQPSYRLVIAEKKSKLKSPPVEDIGSYNPLTKKVTLDKERAGYWVKVGAQPTLTMHNLLVREGVLDAKKKRIPMKKKAAEAEAPAAEAAPAAAAEAPATPAEGGENAPAE